MQIRDLKDTRLPTRQRSLVTMTELFHSPENVSQAIAGNVIPLLISFLASENITCRQKSSEALKILTNHAIGRSAVVKEKLNILKMSKTVRWLIIPSNLTNCDCVV